MKTVFLRALEAEDKATALRTAIREPEAARGKQRFEVDVASFEAVPRSPFAYWVSDRVRQVFREFPAFECERRMAKQGLATSDDFRFLRSAWEVSCSSSSERLWTGFAKGGTHSRFYADIHLAVNWPGTVEGGQELKAFVETTPGTTHWSRRIPSPDFFFRPGLTWPRRTQGGLSIRAMPSGCVFADKGPAAFAMASGFGWIAETHELERGLDVGVSLRLGDPDGGGEMPAPGHDRLLGRALSMC